MTSKRLSNYLIIIIITVSVSWLALSAYQGATDALAVLLALLITLCSIPVVNMHFERQSRSDRKRGADSTITKEPRIVINGQVATDDQSMTIRAALENFDSSLKEDGLGDDSHGKSTVDSYRKNIDSILKMIFADDLNQPKKMQG